MIDLKAVRVGDALSVRPPREALNPLHLEDGDGVMLRESPDVGYRLTP